MKFTNLENRKKALLITYPTEFSKSEALSLAESAGYAIMETVSQRNITRSRFGIGKGKAEEVKEIVSKLSIEVIIFDELLKPSQQYNLARLCKVDVIDREKLILEIFLARATTNESKIQVRLAQLKYDIVRVKEKTRLAKLGEQPGFYGLGKYDADVHLLDIKRRTTLLKKKLKIEERKRALHRTQRLSSNLPLIALAGYTSAGKTTLFNLLAKEKKDTSEKVFTTLTTYTRSFLIEERKALVSDTIGFISRLPPYMIEAFKSTLSELNYADVILLVIDFSEDTVGIRKKLKSSMEILAQLQIPLDKCILVLNKIDKVKSNEIKDKLNELFITKGMDQVISISAELGYNIPSLIKLIKERIDTIKYA
ncbi:GTPase HflX [Candidatus Nitrosocosmicus franklandus]|uniref:GTPase HflX n=1 Tax=Candidatus Nitrosocosmicus franklandianus TaxID=1798806 RepID=A0A484IJS7_9ARCH|nr:GTPase HflX [Candidatus Nitrosocosmicus franklandus]VFJ15139.1 GTPase HflX [Candidatus Nitrosocosmicus franklandus]